jgi:hypothetical protein
VPEEQSQSVHDHGQHYSGEQQLQSMGPQGVEKAVSGIGSNLERASATTTHAYLIDAEGKLSQCDAWFGHQGEYPREFMVSKFYSLAELPIRRR